MEGFNQEFNNSLKTGYLDDIYESRTEYLPQLLYNDKKSGTKVLTALKHELDNCSEFWFSVAFATKGGIATVMNTLAELEQRGIKGKVLVSQYLNFTQPEALKSLLKFKNIELRIVVDEDFHSKGYLFKRDNHFNIIIGSSNFTQTALCTNKEWNLKVSATEKSSIYKKTIKEFQIEFYNAHIVTEAFILHYENIYKSAVKSRTERALLEIPVEKVLTPNTMQVEVLENLNKLREKGINKSLLISATGTGKTYLSAFDVKQFNPKRVLFVVHRLNIAKKAMESFKKIFNDRTMGIFSGAEKNIDSEFVFSTVQTVSKDKYMEMFGPDFFDYIIIDESHRAGASSYHNILNYFNPKFLLGMTATPERTDGLDIFDLFDHNIAGEIRLHRALYEEMLTPFHYYGVSDLLVDGVEKEHDYFKHLIAEERVDRIIEKLNFYGTDSGELRGLVFCSRIDECIALSEEFNNRGFKTIALSGKNSEVEREDAIKKLESEEYLEKIELIFTVDIFNEGIDIPKLNTVIMLRPTQSAIIFVQQLGRGLRKVDGKEYLTVIDFIGNYSSNYLVPVALFGDTSYNKDRIRRLISNGNEGIPGVSTVNFDKISKERIFDSIDNANMQLRKDLIQDYKLLKHKIGRIPTMMDFIDHGSRDPMLYVKYSKSYYNFLITIKEPIGTLDPVCITLLDFFSMEINNAVRVEESIILKELSNSGVTSYSSIKELIFKTFGYKSSDDVITSAIHNINMKFNMTNVDKTRVSLFDKYGYEIVTVKNNEILIGKTLETALDDTTFKHYLLDSISYSLYCYSKDIRESKINNGFILYKKYTRKDVFRILNWEQNPVPQNVGGYIVSPDKSNFPIFVNYRKEDNISSSTKYEDEFVNRHEFTWMSKNRRTLKSPCMVTLQNYKSGLHVPLFIKKSNDEGLDFYYIGDLTPIDDSFIPTTIKDDKGQSVSIVRVNFKISHPVEHSIYNYLTHNF